MVSGQEAEDGFFLVRPQVEVADLVGPVKEAVENLVVGQVGRCQVESVVRHQFAQGGGGRVGRSGMRVRISHGFHFIRMLAYQGVVPYRSRPFPDR